MLIMVFVVFLPGKANFTVKFSKKGELVYSNEQLPVKKILFTATMTKGIPNGFLCRIA